MLFLSRCTLCQLSLMLEINDHVVVLFFVPHATTTIVIFLLIAHPFQANTKPMPLSNDKRKKMSGKVNRAKKHNKGWFFLAANRCFACFIRFALLAHLFIHSSGTEGMPCHTLIVLRPPIFSLLCICWAMYFSDSILLLSLIHTSPRFVYIYIYLCILHITTSRGRVCPRFIKPFLYQPFCLGCGSVCGSQCQSLNTKRVFLKL
ncbi:MAG: hypothetical protein J3R72DRAFT_441540 [Linnemannia gamsii]|nr:MAG: hypothetical protein J3R72DRAFT_441540 [Linnemannia gamsii]